MKLSIIIPTYNSGKTLAACLDSIVGQSYAYFEVLIIDGLSTDDTVEISNKYVVNYSFIKIFSEPDHGIYDAMNKGIRLAKGEWIYFIGSDDVLFHKNTLELLFDKQKEVFDEADVVYGNVIFKEVNIHSNYHENFDLMTFMDTNINHQSIFYKKNVFNVMGEYILTYPVFGDWEFNVRLFFSGQFKIRYVRDIIAIFSLDGTSGKKTDLWLEKRDEVIGVLIQNKPIIFKLKYSNKKNEQKNFWSKIQFLCNKVFIKLLNEKTDVHAQ